jgi:hypothetical protein
MILLQLPRRGFKLRPLRLQGQILKTELTLLIINENSLQEKERDCNQKDIQTFSCTVKEHTIANSASKNGHVEECQYIS